MSGQDRGGGNDLRLRPAGALQDLRRGRVPSAALAAQQGGVGGVMNEAMSKQVQQVRLDGPYPNQAGIFQLREVGLKLHGSARSVHGAAASRDRATGRHNRPARSTGSTSCAAQVSNSARAWRRNSAAGAGSPRRSASAPCASKISHRRRWMPFDSAPARASASKALASSKRPNPISPRARASSKSARKAYTPLAPSTATNSADPSP